MKKGGLEFISLKYYRMWQQKIVNKYLNYSFMGGAATLKNCYALYEVQEES